MKISKIIIKIYFILSIYSFIFVKPSHAADRNDNLGGFLYLGLPFSTLEQGAAERENIGNKGKGLEMGGGLTYYKILSLGFDFGYETYDDKKKFNQSTVGGDFRSTITVPYYSVIGGVKTPPVFFGRSRGLGFTAGLYGGFTWIYKPRREIENCSNCRSENLDIYGGYFLEPSLEIFYGSWSGGRGGFAFSCRKYSEESDFDRRYIFKMIFLTN